MLSVIDNDKIMKFPFFEVLGDIEQELYDLGNVICIRKGNIKKQFKMEFNKKQIKILLIINRIIFVWLY